MAERVPGYFSEDQYRRRIVSEEDARRRQSQDEEARKVAYLRAILLGNVALARNSRAPKNCVVEHMGPGLFSKRARLLGTTPAWYLGVGEVVPSVSSYYDDFPGVNHGFAVTGKGTIYFNGNGMGNRKEFRVGRGQLKFNGVVSYIYGGQLNISDCDSYALGNIVRLEGWSVFK